VDFFVGVEAGVFEDYAGVIEVGGAAEGGESDAAGGKSEEHEIFDCAGAEDQVQLILGERANTLFVDHEIFGADDGGVEFGGGRADYEEIVIFYALEAGFGVGNFWMAGGKAEAYVDYVELFFAGEFYGFGGVGDDGVGSGDEAKNSFLEIEGEECCFFWIEFHGAPFVVFSVRLKIAACPI
jgi:hypothetical protein